MSGPFGSSQWMYASGGFYDYEIGQSLRFNDDDNPYLQITYGSDGTSTAIGTFSFWMKRGNLGDAQENIYFENSGYGGIQLRSDKLAINSFDSSNTQVIVETDAVLRDVASWYHCLIAVNGTAGTIKFYINGTEVSQTVTTGSLVSGRSWDFLNYDSRRTFGIGNAGGNPSVDAYIAEFHHIDGQALDPTSFGETKSGIWIPKQYSGSYGTNGFYLDFSNSGSLGADSSGNSNNFTANNLASTDQMLDSPTQSYATLAANFAGGDMSLGKATLSEGSLKTSGTSSTRGSASTFVVEDGSSIKYYWEVYLNTINTSNEFPRIGIVPVNYTSYWWAPGEASTAGFGFRAYSATANFYNDNSTVFTNNFSAGDIVGIAFDPSSRKVWISDNGSWLNSGDPAAGTGQIATLSAPTGGSWNILAGGDITSGFTVNFGADSTFAGATTAGGNTDDNGNGDFKYTVPSGFVAPAAFSLADPAIDPAQDDVPTDYFNTVLYTGNGGSQSITGVGFQPDLVWIKERSGVADNGLYDSVRGVQNQLESNNTNAETTEATGLTAFGSDGFTIGALAQLNTNTDTYVAWNWKAGGTAVSNTDGSITSSVSANQTSGASIITYTGTGNVETVGHGLGKAPSVLIFKNRTDSSSANWWVHHSGMSNGGNSLIYLDLTNAETTAYDGAEATLGFNPTTTTFTLDSGAARNAVNGSGDSIVCYAFAEIDGFSKAGSYVGNGSSDGPYIHLGFRPAWVMYKTINGTNNHWVIRDNKRDPDNEVLLSLYANLTNADDTGGDNIAIDMLSNGFKARRTNSQVNESGTTYIYLAFAEQPFKYANAR